MTKTVGLLIFEGVEELDFVGPWEVLTMANQVGEMTVDGFVPLDLRLVAPAEGPVRCAKGMRVLPDDTFATCPKLDILLVPGGLVTRELVEQKPFLGEVARLGDGAEWVTSVCTGSMVLAAAGLTGGRKATTHWMAIEEFRQMGKAEVLEAVRFTRDGNLVTSAGVSAGIDMTLWLVGQLWSPAFARDVQKFMEYDPAPPYQAAV